MACIQFSDVFRRTLKRMKNVIYFRSNDLCFLEHLFVMRIIYFILVQVLIVLSVSNRNLCTYAFLAKQSFVYVQLLITLHMLLPIIVFSEKKITIMKSLILECDCDFKHSKDTTSTLNTKH